MEKETQQRCKKLRQEYIDHLNMSNKQPIQEWEHKRKEIHERIFKEIVIRRDSKEGKAFSKKFDASIELELNNYSEIFAKRINRCETKEEMDKEMATLEFIKKWTNPKLKQEDGNSSQA